MGRVKIFVTVTSILFIGFSYYLYTPLPDGIAEPWKVRTLVAGMKTIYLLGGVSEAVGLMDGINMTRTIMNSVTRMSATSMSNPLLEVSDLRFDGIPVRIYKPKSRQSLSPCLVYFHGGGWTFGNIDTSDKLTSYIARAANIIVISVDYRLAPEHPFPIPFDDCVTATIHLLHHAARYGVDEKKVAVAGDNSGGNLAAAIAKRFSEENEDFIPRLKFHLLINPCLQAFDFNLPSYIKYDVPGTLDRREMIRHWMRYMGLRFSEQLMSDFITNNHTSSLLKYSEYAAQVSSKLIPKQYQEQTSKSLNLDHGNDELWRKIEAKVLNPYFAPLMAMDLTKMSPAFVITSEFDVLRDDGMVYAERLRLAGVRVNLYHVKTSFHGFCSAYLHDSTQFDICKKILPDVIEFIEENIH